MTGADLGDRPQRVCALRLWTSASMPSLLQTHEHHELIVPVRGIYRVRTEGAELAARPGELVGFPAGTTHHPQLPRRQGTEFLVVQWWGGPSPQAGVRRDAERRVRLAAEWLLDAQAAGDAAVMLHLAALIAEVAAAGGPATAEAEPAGLVRRLREEMRSKLEAPLTLRELSALVGYSQQHLIRRFRQETGQAPMAWFQEQRLRHARGLLTQGEPLGEVARRCGYRHGRNLLRALRQTGL